MTNANLTHLCLVVDRSGSMHRIAGDMNGAIKTLLEDRAKDEQDTLVDIITFDDKIDVPYENRPPESITEDIILPRGSTALLDAVGFAITRLGRKLSLKPEDERPGNVIVVIVTDGMENASVEFNRQQIAAMVTEQTDKWGWTFMYLAANVDAFATGAGIGISKGQTIAFAASTAGTTNVYDATSSNIGRASRGDRSGYTEDEREASMES